MTTIEVTNTIARMGLNAFTEGAAGAATGTLLVPIGAINGVIYSAVNSIVSELSERMGGYLFQLDQPAASATAKTFVAVASFFGGIAAAWAVLATLGIPLTLTEIVLFGCGSLLWRGAVSCML
ncbi:MAG: hypothetical protein KGQ49_06175, partial [Verrucomicrobia bacterium]|nr:hypothetical protein [Verrucomicrobiota bacterium]